MEGKSGIQGHKSVWSHCIGRWETEETGNRIGYKISIPDSDDLPTALKFYLPKVLPPSKTAPPAGGYVFKHMRQQGTFHIKTIKVENSVFLLPSLPPFFLSSLQFSIWYRTCSWGRDVNNVTHSVLVRLVSIKDWQVDILLSRVLVCIWKEKDFSKEQLLRDWDY